MDVAYTMLLLTGPTEPFIYKTDTGDGGRGSYFKDL